MVTFKFIKKPKKHIRSSYELQKHIKEGGSAIRLFMIHDFCLNINRTLALFSYF